MMENLGMEKLANGKKTETKFPGELSLFLRTHDILHSVASGLGVELPYLQLVAPFAKRASSGCQGKLLWGASVDAAWCRVYVYAAPRRSAKRGQPNGPRGQRSRRAGCHRHPRSGVGGVADASIEEELRCRAQNFAGPSASKNLDLWGLEGNEHLLDLPLFNHPKMVRGV